MGSLPVTVSFLRRMLVGAVVSVYGCEVGTFVFHIRTWRRNHRVRIRYIERCSGADACIEKITSLISTFTEEGLSLKKVSFLKSNDSYFWPPLRYSFRVSLVILTCCAINV